MSPFRHDLFLGRFQDRIGDRRLVDLTRLAAIGGLSCNMSPCAEFAVGYSGGFGHWGWQLALVSYLMCSIYRVMLPIGNFGIPSSPTLGDGLRRSWLA